MIALRPLRAGDAEAVREVAREGWLSAYRRLFDEAYIQAFIERSYPLEHLRSLPVRVDAGRVFFHVAMDDDTIIGFCHVGLGDEGAQLYRIYLRPDHIGRGIGAALLGAAEDWLRERGIGAYHCFVFRDNELGKRFYLRQGFVHRPERDERDEWYMEKELPDVARSA